MGSQTDLQSKGKDVPYRTTFLTEVLPIKRCLFVLHVLTFRAFTDSP